MPQDPSTQLNGDMFAGTVHTGWLLSRARLYDLRLLLSGVDLLRGRWSAADVGRTRRHRAHSYLRIPGCPSALIPQSCDFLRVCFVARVL